jgi:hypothetical protein
MYRKEPIASSGKHLIAPLTAARIGIFTVAGLSANCSPGCWCRRRGYTVTGPIVRLHGVGSIQAQLLWGLLFGSIGLGYFIYGKKQKAAVPLVCGLALMAFPYFVSNVVLLVGIGVLLTAIPYFYRL